MRGLAFAGLAFLAACGGEAVAPEEHHPAPSFKPGDAGFGSTATMYFGKAVGSPFDPAEGHDASPHAADKVRPHIVTIGVGGSVTFEVGPFHQVSIYEAGTETDDIDLSLIEDLTAPFFIPDFLINDPEGRLAANQLTTTLSFTPSTWTSPAGTFDAPGRYLVLCRVFPHFAFSGMYGWVNVK
jgi:plastocyanin